MHARWLVTALAMLAAWPAARAQNKPPPQEPQLRIETGMHTATIKRIGVDAACKRLVTGSDDKTARLWDVSADKPRLLRTLRVPIGEGDNGKIYAVALAPDGGLVAAGGWDAAYSAGGSMFVYLFDADTGRLVRRLGPLGSVILHLAFSPDGRFLAATLGAGQGVRAWEISSWQLVLEDKDYGGNSYGAAFSSDNRLFTADFSGHIRRYSLHAGQFRRDGMGETRVGKEPYNVAVHPKGDRLAVGFSETVAVEVYDAGTLKRLYAADTSGVDNGVLFAVAWSAAAKGHARLAAGGTYWRSGNVIILWGQDGKGPGRDVAVADNTINHLLPCRAGWAFGAGDPAFGLIDAEGRKRLWRAPVTADLRYQYGAAFTLSPDGARVRFGLKVFGKEPVLFDLMAGRLEAAETPPPGLAPADTASLPVTGWKDEITPALDGKPLPLEPYETSRALAIAPDKARFVLGADFALRAYRHDGEKLWEKPVPSVAWDVNISGKGKLVVAGYADGTIRWHRLEDGQELLALFVDAKDRRWVAWTPKGYYMASPGAEDLIGWHVNRGWDEAADFFPASKFRDAFYRPDIVRRVLVTLDEDKAIDEANTRAKRQRAEEDILKRQPPVITITNLRDGDSFSTPKLKVDYSVRSPSGLAIKRIWALIDGREVEQSKGFVPVAPGKTGSNIEGSLPLDLPQRDVTLALLAETDEGVASVPATVNLSWAGARAAPTLTQQLETSAAEAAVKPRLYALLIGVAKYKDPAIQSLDYAAKDALDMETVLKLQKGLKERLYSDVEVKTLTDAEATQKEIFKGLGWLAKAPAQGDVAILFVSGHGFTDETGDYQFMPYDAEVEQTAFGVTPVEGTGVPHSEFKRALQRVQRAHTFFLFDTCHAGDATGAKFKGAPESYGKFVSELSSAETGARVLASSEGRELSIESKEWQNGAFTKALVEALHGKADFGKEGVVRSSELVAYVQRRVAKLTSDRQHPVVQDPEMVRDIPIVAVGH